MKLFSKRAIDQFLLEIIRSSTIQWGFFPGSLHFTGKFQQQGRSHPIPHLGGDNH